MIFKNGFEEGVQANTPNPLWIRPWGWALNEDESIITGILEEILSILVSYPFSCYSQEVMIDLCPFAKVAFIEFQIYFIGPDKQMFLCIKMQILSYSLVILCVFGAH